MLSTIFQPQNDGVSLWQNGNKGDTFLGAVSLKCHARETKHDAWYMYKYSSHFKHHQGQSYWFERFRFDSGQLRMKTQIYGY